MPVETINISHAGLRSLYRYPRRVIPGSFYDSLSLVKFPA
jgi:hypothetical protein